MYMHTAQKGREVRLNRNPKILAVAGKGGVGKTSLSAAFVRLLTETHPDARILAIDADPAVGLSTALGVEVRQTLDDIRKQIVSSVEDGEPREAIELLSEARYRIFDTMVEPAEILLPGHRPAGDRRVLLQGQRLPQGDHQSSGR